MSQTIREEIKKMVCDNSKVKVEINQLSDDMNLQKDLGYDSITIIELISKLEEKFDIDFDYSDLDVEKISIYKGLEMLVLDYVKEV